MDGEGFEALGFVMLFSVFYVLIIPIIFWIIDGIIINRLNKEMYGKTTALAWVPFCNIYLLGKLTVNKTIGWVLVISNVLTANYTTTINGVQKTYSILPSSISSLLSSIVSTITFCLLIYAIIKYKRLKKSNNIQSQANIAQQQMYQQQAYQQPQPMMNGQTYQQQPIMNGQVYQQQPAMNGQPTYQQPLPMTNGQPTYQQQVPQQQVPQQTMGMQQPQQPINSFCTNCGAKFNGNEAFCTNCGTPRQ